VHVESNFEKESFCLLWRSALKLQILLCLCLLALAVDRVLAADVEPGGNLVARGIPRIPGDIVERARRYSEFRAASFVGWHPTRRVMLISTRFGATVQIHQVAFMQKYLLNE
jgi:hypothetical protein